MAFKLPGFKFFSTADAKSRVFFLLIGVVSISFFIYLASRYLGGDSGTGGASKVATAPGGMQSVPGSQLSPEYYRAVMQANVQSAQQAQMTGGSAVPTLVNQGDQLPGTGTQNCTILCPSEDNVNVAEDINGLLRAGKLSQADANRLLDLAKRNVSVAEYAAALDELVRQGKLTPEQARQLLEKYKKQHEKALLNESGAAMDGLVKSGQLSLETATDLLELQKKNVSPEDYAASLQRVVKEGKMTPQMAARLLAQYTQQHAREAAKEGAFKLQKMAKAGEITPDVAKLLTDMQGKAVPVEDYDVLLNRLVKEGKLTPAAAEKLLADYKKQRAQAAAGPLNDLLAKGGAAGAEGQKLLDMQLNNASLSDYAEELKRAVTAGLISPQMAARLLQQYEALMAPVSAAGTLPTVDSTIPGAEDFAKLQQHMEGQQPTTVSNGESDQFAAAAAQANAEALQRRQERIQQMMQMMSTQAQSLLTAWQPIAMEHKEGTPPDKTTDAAGAAAKPGSAAKNPLTDQAPTQPPLIKAGSILFAILDTGVDSDYPDTPVMATIVQGPFKGAKLLGKLTLATGQDRVSLNFSLMNKDDWLKSKSISAFAMDPDTARTVLASNVDYHYLKRYGAMFASSFLTGYASAIQNAGSTQTTGIFGTSTVNSPLSPAAKIAVGLGQVGTAFSAAVGSYVNTPTTVKVNSGVGLGILFVSDVSS